jgi:hypothetical protein
MSSFLAGAFLILRLLGPLSGCEPFGNTDPPVLQPILDDSPNISMGSYYGKPMPAVPGGAHKAIDHVAPVATAIKASASGTITDVSETTEPFLHTWVWLELNRRYTLIYTFETAQSITVAVGQRVEAGDILGYLGHLDLLPPTHGQLDWMLLADGEQICPLPFVTAEHRALLETWFTRGWGAASADAPGPCACHYTFP